MRILTIDNTTFDIDEVPDEVDDVRFCTLSYKDEIETDFYFRSLLFLESFTDTKADVQIGDNTVPVPLEWSIVCGDQHTGDLELLPLMTLNDRDFDALVYNPLSGFRLDYRRVKINNVFPNVKWYVPKTGLGQILALPLTSGNKPDCIFVAHAKQNKIPERLDINWIF